MIPVQRKERIRVLLQKSEILTLPELVLDLGISQSTLRRDLREMAQEGEVDLLRGGGIRMRREEGEWSLRQTVRHGEEEKRRIAAYAARLIFPGDILFLDASSVSYLLIDDLTPERLVVATNSIAHAGKLIQRKISCILVGGMVESDRRASVGPLAEKMMQGLRFTKCFLGTTGLSRTMGLTCRSPQIASLHRMAIDRAGTTYFLVDSGKYDVVTLCKTADIDECKIIVDVPHPVVEDLSNVIYAGREGQARETE